MKHTTVFQLPDEVIKDIDPENIITDAPKEARSKLDYCLAKSLGIDLTIDKSPAAKRIKYLKRYLMDLELIPQEMRPKTVICWDTETTSFTGFICSIAMEKIDLQTGRIIDSYYQEINPDHPIDPEAFAVHKLSEEHLSTMPQFKEKVEEISAFLSDCDYFVGHKLDFDIGILQREFRRLGTEYPFYDKPFFDTNKAASEVCLLETENGRRKAPTLTELVEFYYGEENLSKIVFHNAKDDVEWTSKVFLKLISEDHKAYSTACYSSNTALLGSLKDLK